MATWLYLLLIRVTIHNDVHVQVVTETTEINEDAHLDQAGLVLPPLLLLLLLLLPARHQVNDVTRQAVGPRERRVSLRGDLK